MAAAASGAFGNHAVNMCPGEPEEPPEGGSYRQQESRLCQQMKMASVSQGGAAASWFQEEAALCSGAQSGPGQKLPSSRPSSQRL